MNASQYSWNAEDSGTSPLGQKCPPIIDRFEHWLFLGDVLKLYPLKHELQWNLSIEDTLGTAEYVFISEVSSFQR